MIIDNRCNIPNDEREYYSRYVNFRPGDGQIVHLNPPRFSWGYLPDVVPESTRVPMVARFGGVPLRWNKWVKVNDAQTESIWSGRSELLERLLADKCEQSSFVPDVPLLAVHY